MKLTDVLERNANKAIEVQTVNSETVTASSWRIGEDVLEARKQQGFSVYIPLDKIVFVKVTTG